MMFLPLDYQAPKPAGHYFKMQEGENRIRILSQPVFGWEDWKDKKPVRYRMDNKPAKPFDASKPVKHFWAFVIFNYRDEQVQIMQVTQATIRKSLEALCRDSDWGAPFAYDIKINKSGEGVDTEYTVNPVPHKPVDEYIVKQFNEKPINLEALFDGVDPFTLGNVTKCTPIATIGDMDVKSVEIGISEKQGKELETLFEECDPGYKEHLLKIFSQLPKPVSNVKDIPITFYDKLRNAMIKNINEFKNTLAQSEHLLVEV